MKTASTVPLSSFSVRDLFVEHGQEVVQVAQETFQTLGEVFESSVSLCVEKLKSGGKLLFFGNGGSAGDAQHLATEFVVRFSRDRAPLPAMALTADTALLTAAGNDLGFEQIFARQVEALGRPEDVVIALSTSGRSPNILAGLRKAQQMGIERIGLTGKTGGEMSSLCTFCFHVPSLTTARIQEMHLALGQILCAAIEESLF